MVWTQESCHKYVNYDHSGECSPEKDGFGWLWLTFRQPERKSSSESSELWNVSRWYICLWLLTWLVNEVEMLLVVCQTTNNISTSQDYTHPDDHNLRTNKIRINSFVAINTFLGVLSTLQHPSEIGKTKVNWTTFRWDLWLMAERQGKVAELVFRNLSWRVSSPAFRIYRC